MNSKRLKIICDAVQAIIKKADMTGQSADLYSAITVFATKTPTKLEVLCELASRRILGIKELVKDELFRNFYCLQVKNCTDPEIAYRLVVNTLTTLNVTYIFNGEPTSTCDLEYVINSLSEDNLRSEKERDNIYDAEDRIEEARKRIEDCEQDMKDDLKKYASCRDKKVIDKIRTIHQDKKKMLRQIIRSAQKTIISLSEIKEKKDRKHNCPFVNRGECSYRTESFVYSCKDLPVLYELKDLLDSVRLNFVKTDRERALNIGNQTVSRTYRNYSPTSVDIDGSEYGGADSTKIITGPYDERIVAFAKKKNK